VNRWLKIFLSFKEDGLDYQEIGDVEIKANKKNGAKGKQ
jgi:hypothetical protein